MERKKFLGNALKFIRSRMKFFHQPSAISLQPYLFLALAIWGCGNAMAIDRENLKFYLPFEGTLQPRIAGANTQLTFAKGTAQDAQLVAGRRGQGLKVTPELILHYQTRESFSAKECTVAFWMKPVGSWGDMRCIRYFLLICSDQISMQFYAFYGVPYIWVACPTRYDLIGGPNWEAAFAQKPFADEQWIFLAGTFKPGQQAFYINDRQVICRTDALIEPEFIKTGTIDIPAGDQVLDEIMVFDRVLTEQEISAVYRANAPQR